MKRTLLILFSLAFFSCQSNYTNNSNQTDTSLTTLSSDTSLINKPEAVWAIDSFVDEFGDSEGTKYVESKSVGNFSNSATSNAYLRIELIITTKNCGIFLHEYHDNEPAVKFIGSGKIRLKNSDGKEITVYSYSEWNQNGGLLIDDDNYIKLRNFLLKSSGTIKAVIYDDYSSVFRFSFDLSGFSNLFNELKK